MKKKFLSLLLGLTLLSALSLLLPTRALAIQLCDSPSGGQGIDTAIGCIPLVSGTSQDPNENLFLGFLLRWAIGIAGGIAFILIIYASFTIMSSSGEPTKLKAGQEMLTSAISGLILLIFSVFILRLIGISILNLPGF